MKTLTHYEIICALHNTKSENKPNYKNRNNKVSKATLCKGHNLSIMQGDHFVTFMAVNPLQTNGRTDTPVYKCFSDGTKQKVSSKSFFLQLVEEDWMELKVDLPADIQDDIWEDDIEDRVKSISLIVDASSLDAFNESFDLGYAKLNKNGRMIRHCEFVGEVVFNKTTINTSPLRLKALPEVLTEDEYELANPPKVKEEKVEEVVKSSIRSKAASEVIQAPVLYENVVVDNLGKPSEVSSKSDVFDDVSPTAW